MFKIEFYVDDKNLGEAFKRLAGVARNLTHAYVPNLEPKANGKIRMSAADSTEMLIKEMHKRHLTELTSVNAKEVMVAIGMSPTSYSHILNQAVERGVMTKRKLKPGGVAMIYSLKQEKK